jgi:hypothetical protein
MGGATVGGAAGGLSLASMGFKMFGDYFTSRSEAAGDVFKAEELEQQATYGQLKAAQTNAQATRNLTISLGHIDAVRAANRTDVTSPTGAAVRGEVEEQGEMKKEISVTSLLEQARLDEAGAQYMRDQSSRALLSGDISMVGDLLTGGAGALKATGAPATTSLSSIFGV